MHAVRTLAGWLAAAITVSALGASAGEFTKTKQSSRLYTQADPSAAGGIRGKVGHPDQRIEGAFAIAQFEPARVYAGSVGADGRSFEFAGLPTGKYDLMLLYGSFFIEGVRLCRETDSLNDGDRKAIKATVDRSVPFFDTKVIHRVEGVTGHAGKAMAVEQDMRTRPVTLQSAEVRDDIQIRSLKIATLEDVGTAGWHLTNTREVVRQEVGGGQHKGPIDHRHAPEIGNIRVVDSVKDLGTLELK